ncbi:catabolite control protein A [Abditibacteriota bacterium]|nr:catabolite control protein A [Abditibacteriota bacterium]
MRSTIRQVAERAGVSRTTVSNVLLGRNDIVAPEKRDMVLQAARDLDYVPVRSTLQNRHVETRVIAVPFNDPTKIGWAINSGTYTGICKEAMAQSYDVLMLLRSDPDWAVERSEVQFLDRRSDGIIFASPIIGEGPQTFAALIRHKIPAVVCYRRDLPEGIAWVDVDNRAAMYGAVEYLWKRGHRRIVHLSENLQLSFDNRERRRYFSEAMQKFGLDEWSNTVVETHYHAATPALAEEIIGLGATGVVAMNDLLAIDLKKAMVNAGLNVPRDLSIVGVDGVEAETYDLTSMEFSFVDIGRKATEVLVARINGQSAQQCSRQVPVRLVERGSVQDLSRM